MKLSRWVVLVPSLLLISICGWIMYQATAQSQLWGYYSLGFQLGLLGLIIALFTKKIAQKPLLLAVGSGLSLGVGFGSSLAIPLMCVGIALLLYLIDTLYKDQKGNRSALYYLFILFATYNVVATWWVGNAMLFAGLVANYFNALLQATPLLLAWGARRKLPNVWIGYTFLGLVGFEFLHYNWQIAWPWLALGNGLSQWPQLVQWYSYTGIFGGTLWLFLLGYFVYQAVIAYPKIKTSALGQFLAVLLLPVAFSVFQYYSYEIPEKTKEASVALVQPNFEPHYVKFNVSEQTVANRIDSLLKTCPPYDLAVFPETSYGNYNEDVLQATYLFQQWQYLAERQKEQGRSQPALLAGISSYKVVRNPTSWKGIRTSIRGTDTTYYYSANTAISLEEEDFNLYHKSKLVPGTEFFPYSNIFFFFKPLIDALGGSIAGLWQDEEPKVFEYKNGVKAAPLICYESIYGDYVRQFVLKGANLLVVPTNDGWWDDTPGQRQHLDFAILRAIENRRFVVQAANSGTSAVVDPWGRVIQQTKYNEPALIHADVPLIESEPTFYTANGDMIGRVSLGMYLIVLVSFLGRQVLLKK